MQSAIEKAVVGRTVIIVAHRLSTIQRATQIVVLDKHQIVDVGSHNELLQRCPKYQELIKRQSLVHRGAKEMDNFKAPIATIHLGQSIPEEGEGEELAAQSTAV